MISKRIWFLGILLLIAVVFWLSFRKPSNPCPGAAIFVPCEAR